MTSIQDQATGALSDLKGFFPNLIRRDTWLRTLIAVVAVGLVFVFAVRSLSKLGGPAKKVADRIL